MKEEHLGVLVDLLVHRELRLFIAAHSSALFFVANAAVGQNATDAAAVFTS